MFEREKKREWGTKRTHDDEMFSDVTDQVSDSNDSNAKKKEK